MFRPSSGARLLPLLGQKVKGSSRALNTSAPLGAVQSGRFRVSVKKDNPLTYEQAHKPHEIGMKKEWTSFNTSNLHKFGLWKSEITLQDVFIRKFVTGTWHDLFVSEVLIKRQGNLIRVAGIVHRGIHARKMYFLIGYCEEFLGYWLQCPVRMEIQTVDNKKDVIFKYV